MSVRILGVDPGTSLVGYGAIDRTDKTPRYVTSGTIAAPSSLSLGKRLSVIHREILQVFDSLHPDVVVLEKVFFGKNVSTLVKIGEGRGVILLACAQAEIALAEYTPALVKKALCGRGAAPKEQVAFLVRQTLRVKDDLEMGPDATDALALALCHASRMEFAEFLNLRGSMQARALEQKRSGPKRFLLAGENDLP